MATQQACSGHYDFYLGVCYRLLFPLCRFGGSQDATYSWWRAMRPCRLRGEIYGCLLFFA